ncbi:Oidioi.mRNA.OKI2018_I69.chr2.g6682.t2.cds [Oikopleura dioica]|uniref:Oidioi.mRNA.OKI2018_I69.chr2.g6682.t2.cds n=1 Tax=Oikopleura dioica TaxID=34765 RepID=A0ABN7TAD1_OIKDI|nr:Oidioi.mRNA.OKI2018_I69.chr2.g6682.t2.cds [Oikopleura dioica]
MQAHYSEESLIHQAKEEVFFGTWKSIDQLEGEEFKLQRLIEERLKAEFGENEEEDEEDMNSLISTDLTDRAQKRIQREQETTSEEKVMDAKVANLSTLKWYSPDALVKSESQKAAKQRKEIIKTMARGSQSKSVLKRWEAPKPEPSTEDKLSGKELDSHKKYQERRRSRIKDWSGVSNSFQRNTENGTENGTSQNSNPDIDTSTPNIKNIMSQWKVSQIPHREPSYKRPNRIEDRINDEIRQAAEKEALYRKEKGLLNAPKAPERESKSDLEDATRKLEQLNRIEEELARIERETMSRANSSSNSEQINGHQEEPAREVVEDPDYQLILDAEPSPNTTLDESDHIEPEMEEPKPAIEPEAEPISEQVEPEPEDVESNDVEGAEEGQAEPEEDTEAEKEIESKALPIISPDEPEIEDKVEKTAEQNSKIDQDENAQLDTSQDIPESNTTQDDNEEEEEVELPEVPAEVQDDIDKFEELANLVDKSAAELTSNAGSISDSGIDHKDESQNSMTTSIEFNPPRDSVSSPLPSASSDHPDHPDHQSADGDENKVDEEQNNNRETNTTKWLKSIAPRGWKSSYSSTSSRRSSTDQTDDVFNSSQYSNLDSLPSPVKEVGTTDISSLPLRRESEKAPIPYARAPRPRFSISSARQTAQTIIDTEIESFKEREAELREIRMSSSSS